MNSSPLKVAPATSSRSDKEAQRAKPVSLPAGSYNLAALRKPLDEAALAKNDGKRDELVAKAVADANQTPRPDDTFGVPPGYKRVDVVDKVAGVEEQRVVFDTDKRAEAEAAQDEPPAEPAKGDAAPAKKGE
jgi:hypothetical protein